MKTKMPSETEKAEFIDWLRSILRNPENVKPWAEYIIQQHDWSSSRRIEISRQQTRTGNAEIYSF